MAHLLPIDPNPFTGEPMAPAEAGDQATGPGLAAVSRWLYFTYGITAAVPHEPRPLYLRAAPSAGGLYPAELYLVVQDGVAGLDPGLYGYDPLKHRLVPLAPGGDAATGLQAACYGDAAVAAAPLALVVTGVFARSAWRYRERAYRRILLDSGHLIGNALLVASNLGLRPHLTAAFCDDRLEVLLRLDPDLEGGLAVVAAGVPQPSPRPSWSALPSGIAKPDPNAPLLPALHVAGRLGPERPKLIARGDEQADELERRYGYTGGEDIAAADEGECPLAESLFDSILHRRSTRRYRRGSIEKDQLARILACAYAPERMGLGLQPGIDRGELMTFVAVAAVEGLARGVYYFAPHGRSLRLLRAGLDREAVQYLCLGQELGGDAAATIFHTADLPTAVARQGDRAYRYLHLDAGILGQRLNLGALAEGLGASGIGGFFDDHVNRLIGIPEEQAVIYITTIGVPADGE